MQKPENDSKTESDQKASSSATAKVAKRQLRVGQKIINVEIAATPGELRQGLSGRASLEEDSGMYFELGQKRNATFWMKDMNFPIDIIWIDSGVIVGVEQNAPISTSAQIPTFTSPVPVTNVLEVPAGFFNETNLKIGDSVVLVN